MRKAISTEKWDLNFMKIDHSIREIFRTRGYVEAVVDLPLGGECLWSMGGELGVFIVVGHPGRFASGSPDAVQIIGMVPVHAEKVFLDVVCTVKLFLTHITLERFLISVNVLVTGEEIAAVRRVRAEGATVAFSGGVFSPRGLNGLPGGGWHVLSLHGGWWWGRRLNTPLQALQVLGHFF